MDNRNALRNPCNAARCFMPYKICKKTPSDPLTSEDTEVSTKNHAIGHDTRCRCYFFWGLARSWNYHITFFALILVARFGFCPSHHRMDYLAVCCVQLTIENKGCAIIRDVCFGQRRTLCKVAQVPQSMLFPLLPETEEAQLRLVGSICKNTLKQSSFKLLEEFYKLALGSNSGIKNCEKSGNTSSFAIPRHDELVLGVFISINPRLSGSHGNEADPSIIGRSASRIENKAGIIFGFYTCPYKKSCKIQGSICSLVHIAFTDRCSCSCK